MKIGNKRVKIAHKVFRLYKCRYNSSGKWNNYSTSLKHKYLIFNNSKQNLITMTLLTIKKLNNQIPTYPQKYCPSLNSQK